MTEKTPISYRHIFGIAFPIILSSMAQNVIALADTVFLGNIGEAELAAAALASVFYSVLVMLMTGFGIGTQIIIARKLGESQSRSIGRIFQHSAWFMLFSSILIFALFQLFGTNILQFLIQTPAVRIAVKEYLYTRIYGLPFAFISLSFNAFYVGTARTRTISIATIIMGIVNVILDYIFIFGKLHCPAMGMQGAALASVIAEGIGLSVYFIKSITAVNYVRFRIFDKFNLHRTLFGHMINMSYPIMFQYFISFANYFLFFIFIETLGQKSLAIANITRSMYIIFLLPVWGYAATTASLTSFLCGQKRENEIFMVVKKAIILGVISVSIIVLPYLLFHNFILNLFTNDPNLATESFVPSLVCIVASFTMALGQIVFHTIIGQGKTKVSLGIDFVNLIFYILYAWYVILYLKSSVAVAFGVEIMYTVGLLIISCIYLYYTKHFSKKVLMDKQL